VIAGFFGKDDYYVRSSPTRCAGRLAWAPVLFQPVKGAVKVLCEAQNGTWGLKNLDSNCFTSRSHRPLVSPFRLELKEEALLVKAKKRPVVLLANPSFPELLNLSAAGANAKLQPRLNVSWLAAPMHSQHHGPDFQRLVESLYFPQFFPMLGNGACPEVASFCRLDLLQVVHESLIEVSGYEMKNAEPWTMLREAAMSYLTGQLHGETYSYYRGEFVAELKRQGILY
jgi:hypothetical protein